MRQIPLDPITKATDWVLTDGGRPQSSGGPVARLPEPGIIDVHSSSKEDAAGRDELQ